jgi:hypothetical protein
MEDMMRPMKLSVIAATAILAAMPVVLSEPANAQPRNGPWGDRDRDGIPNQFDRNNSNNNWRANNSRGSRGDQDHDGIPNKYDTDRDGDGTPDRWDRSPASPHRR